MKNVRELQVIQVRIFPEDVIPYQILSVARELKSLRDRYQFSSEEIPFPLHVSETPKIIMLRAGEAQLDEKNIIFNLLHFEGRKIVIDIFGTSEDADQVFTDLSDFINRLASKGLLSEKNWIVKTEETKCTVCLNIDYWSIFDNKMKRFIDENIASALDQRALSICPKRLTFEVVFKQDSKLEKNNIRYAPKFFTIEPRINIPFEENIFYTQSPFDSDTHLRILESLESVFSKAQPAIKLISKERKRRVPKISLKR